MKHTIKRARHLKPWLKNRFAFPGGYEIALYIGGDRLCRDCLLEDWAWTLERPQEISMGVYWEGPADYCAHCGKELPSEYGDPNEDN